MKPFVAYAKIPMSFLNLYRLRGGARGHYTVAIAFAMSGVLVINIWSALLVLAIVTNTSLVGTHFVEAGPYALFVALVFALELTFVHFVQKRVRNDPIFAKKVATTSPRVSMWYAGVSVGLLAASTLAMNLAA